MRGLKGKSALVTGGSRGIGKAYVDRLLEEGVKVLFCGRNAESGRKTLEEMRAKYKDGVVEFMAADMDDVKTPELLIAKAIELFGGLDFLVNNAFPFTAKGVDATIEDWEHTMMAGPVAYARMIQEYVKQRGRGKGAIVLTSSISGLIAQPNRWTYNMAKGAVKQLTRCAAMDLAPDIRVNCLSPGWVWTDEVAKATPDGTRESAPKAWDEYHLINRLQETDEIAASMAFLLSDDACAVTGHDLFAEGGYLAMGPEGIGKDANFAGSV